MEVTLFAFAKADNSTAIPTGGAVVTGVLRSPCSIQSPQIEFDLQTSVAPQYNYAYIADFARYYKITNWRWDAPLWVAEMAVDVLATYKENIGSSTQYVLRSASTYNEIIIDNFYPALAPSKFLFNGVVFDKTLYGGITGGCYILGIINNDSGAIGSVSYYIFSNAQLRSLCDQLFISTDWLGSIEDISSELLKSLFNPFQYIVSCNWFPFLVAGTAVSTLKFGWWELSVTCQKLTFSEEIISGTVTIPKQSGILAYKKLSPFYSYRLVCGTFGEVEIDPSIVLTETTMYVTIRCDLISGMATLFLSLDSAYPETHAFTTSQSMMGVPIQLAQVMRDYVGIATSTIGTIGGLIGGALSGGIGGMLSGGMSAVGSLTDSLKPEVSTGGQNGATNAWAVAPYLRLKYCNTVENDIERFGIPLCRKVVINTLSGFVLVQNAHVDSASTATAEEIREIENYMEGGFFYE